MLVPAGCLRLRVLLRVGCSTGKDREFRVFRFRGRGSVGLPALGLLLFLCSCVDHGKVILGDRAV